ncbi:hypothetical protein SERLA73DRAFT_51799 [Serpula lacrymans var. lacrymans S7.3]|uniref:Endoplasmic oxidoreductin-1 n=2 Tax=Serpula lacrymans var. lacrymans TaxID=341189 RepID=F8PUD7_SERL3|nr:hypothetical protein SERLA73DRAFT_51799 [Serpula lacrymans var. lacrymans S7.3]
MRHTHLQRACLALVFSPLGIEATSFLSDTLIRKGQVQNVLEHQPAKESFCQHAVRPQAGPIETTMCDYETIESVNSELYRNLHEVVHTPFFRYFQVDLYRDCPFWQENGFCMNRECGITTVDESEIPEKWRAASLSKIDLPPPDQRIQLPGCYYRDSDYCFLDDMTEGDYVDLSQIPERYTGYSGPSAHRVWKSIYEENCFGLSELNLMTGQSPSLVTLPDTMSDVLREDTAAEDESTGACLEKRVYYKIVSGLHASISTHICREYLNQTTGEMSPNLECFVTRVASHPERLQYIYFNTVLLLRAVARIGPYLSAYDYCSLATPTPHDHSDNPEGDDTLNKLSNVITIAEHVGKFDESVLFRGENANVLKQEFKNHFRNVSRIMDCVGCDKCRLWGKVQTTGLATALKILFEMDEKALNPHSNTKLLQRSEVVALVNTLHRFSESLEAVEDFRKMWKETGDFDSRRLINEAERAPRHGEPTRHDTLSHRPEFINRLQFQLQYLIEVCKKRTMGCLGVFLQMWERLGEVVSPNRNEL